MADSTMDMDTTAGDQTPGNNSEKKKKKKKKKDADEDAE